MSSCLCGTAPAWTSSCVLRAVRLLPLSDPPGLELLLLNPAGVVFSSDHCVFSKLFRLIRTRPDGLAAPPDWVQLDLQVSTRPSLSLRDVSVVLR